VVSTTNKNSASIKHSGKLVFDQVEWPMAIAGLPVVGHVATDDVPGVLMAQSRKVNRVAPKRS